MGKGLQINIKRLEKTLKEESKKHGWGLILIAREELHNIVMLFRPSIILEIGCHNKLLEKTLREWGFEGEYVGLDVIAYDVKIDVMASGDHSPFRSKSFDMIIMLETLEHIPDYVKCLRECKKVLKDGGLLFIQSVICFDNCAYEGDETHFHVLHPKCLERLAGLVGFVKVIDGLIGNTFWILLKQVVT